MLGYDISWAAFNIIEVMSSTKFNFVSKKKIVHANLFTIFFKSTSVSIFLRDYHRELISTQF